jgi:hypothetical protein
MEFHLKTIGILLSILDFIHLGFPRYFDWKNELKSLNLVNRQIFKVHTFFIGLVVLLIGLLCYFCSSELVTTELGRKICIGLSVFWILRLYFQLFFYSTDLWKGKKLETNIHIVFTAFWIYMCWVFICISLT